ncbi:Exo_endo_phos domain-containing protein [Cephalotus follicularis]|uniref:Exo_endo_phos domain-containing protein n=1 Tax=Cephalotus follicularis TaxID=3775 RepID=A0A1Q3ATC5_CEPFO|nr:Exo_endo_phos domain-containing protein [Cephalotus follicularis]
MFSVVYASPIPTMREILWGSMFEWSNQFDISWLVMSDLNDFAIPSEHKGKKKPSLTRCLKFQENLNRCGLIDLGFNGPCFTWTNCRKGLENVQVRLDRCLANPSWKEFFPEALLNHLPRTHSDHNPSLPGSLALSLRFRCCFPTGLETE